MKLLGIDVGTSAVKAAILDPATGAAWGSAQFPETGELPLHSPRPGWAEQNPEDWLGAAKAAIRALPESERAEVKAIGIAYQMHGLVLCGEDGLPTRPAIIWCDSRALAQGDALLEAVGQPLCEQRLLNHPGNFTCSKMLWTAQHEPEALSQARWAFLPGEWLSYRLTGTAATTPTGLSERIAWDFAGQSPCDEIWEATGAPLALRPPVLPTFGPAGHLLPEIAAELGLPAGIPVAYRAGDQPNGALALGVMKPGEAAASAGTSGVMYAVMGSLNLGIPHGVNVFLHVNDRPAVLMCLNGAGAAYAWLRRTFFPGMTFSELNAVAAQARPGCDGLKFVPYGNGAERLLGGDSGAGWRELHFAQHGAPEIARSVLEGIVEGFGVGAQAMARAGARARSLQAGRANLFLSDLFGQMLSDSLGVSIELRAADGALGAARGAGMGLGISDIPQPALLGSWEPAD